MILAKPVISILLVILVIIYFTKIRSRATDSLVVMVFFLLAILFVFRPDLANNLAHVFGIGRGVDLIFYFVIPGLSMLVLLLFAKVRDLNSKLTSIVRELALHNANVAAPETEPHHSKNA